MTEATAGTRPPACRSGGTGFYNKGVQGVVWQVVTLGAVLGIGWYLYSNMLHNLETRRTLQHGMQQATA